MPFFLVFHSLLLLLVFCYAPIVFAALSSSDYTYNLLKFVAFLPDRLASLQRCCNRTPATSIGRFNGLCEHSWRDSLREKVFSLRVATSAVQAGLLVKPGRCDLQEIRGLSIIAQIMVRPRQVKINGRLIWSVIESDRFFKMNQRFFVLT